MLTNLIGLRRSWAVFLLSLVASFLILGSAGNESSTATGATDGLPQGKQSTEVIVAQQKLPGDAINPCLLYTSDAADD